MYVWYTMHGGIQEEEKLHEKDPLKKHVSLQTKVAKFKSRTRKLAIFCMQEDDEWQIGTAYNRQNRLSKLAITNKHACIRGVPKMSVKEAEAVTEAIIAMRGAHRKLQKEALKEGILELPKKPFAYKGTSDTWMTVAKGYEDWTLCPNVQVEPKMKILEHIYCPKCGSAKRTEGLKLKVRSGFCNLPCKSCDSTTPAKAWECGCAMKWQKCPEHEHVFILRQRTRLYTKHFGWRGKRPTEHGSEQPMPKRRRTINPDSALPDASVQTRCVNLPRGSILVLRFPHLVQRPNA
jgi:hypothetical protein